MFVCVCEIMHYISDNCSPQTIFAVWLALIGAQQIYNYTTKTMAHEEKIKRGYQKNRYKFLVFYSDTINYYDGVQCATR